jgi:N-acyl homoserine lactone hydrolase
MINHLALVGALLLGTYAVAAKAAGVDRLYVLDCGAARAPDQSRWSPGVDVGQPIEIVDNCYLIHDGGGYLLWDTGVPDQL